MSKKKVRIINGVNNNFYGIRDKAKYGVVMYKDLEKMWIEFGQGIGLDVEVYQSNIEGEIVDYMQKCYNEGVDGIILNPAAFTHYSYAIYDAIRSINHQVPVIEIHMDNIYRMDREHFRWTSVTVPACVGMILGFGPKSYCLALEAFKMRFDEEEKNGPAKAE